VTELQTNAGIEVERTDFVPLATQDKERALEFYGETLDSASVTWRSSPIRTATR
jgi:hypothetical protein